MKSKSIFSFIVAIAMISIQSMSAQVGPDVIGTHDLSPAGNSSLKGGISGSCLYCHAPHTGTGVTPLWNQTFSTQTYTVYGTNSANITTYQNKGNTAPAIGTQSTLCLSCHDGSVAPGQTKEFGQITMTGSMKTAATNPPYQVDVFTSNLQGSHPFSLILPLQDAPDLAEPLKQGKTADPLNQVQLIKGNVECTSCHNPHVQSIDTKNPNFLVRDGSGGQLCLACHDPSRVMTGKTNLLSGWTNSIHASSTSQTTTQGWSYVGPYSTVAANSCLGCHMPHNSSAGTKLLRGVGELDCLGCHGQLAGGTSNLTAAPPNVYATSGKTSHLIANTAYPHDAAELPLLTQQNRHSTCVDCHSPHASNQVSTFTLPPTIRPSQNGVSGISASDGVSPVLPAVNQYEICLRCHGTSPGKQALAVYGYLPAWVASAGDPLDVDAQFGSTTKIPTSSHPVTHDSSTANAFQPSLRPNILKLDGSPQGRAMGTQILCTDCHNADDNREFGGVGANGPHYSKWTHLLERRYEFSQATVPGQLISTNLFPNPDLTITGPYAMCDKCHDLTNVVSNASFSEHYRHIVTDGFTCSTCHTAHGVQGAASINGARLVNFDANIVAANGTTPISYNRTTNSCSLVCHGHAHALK